MTLVFKTLLFSLIFFLVSCRDYSNHEDIEFLINGRMVRPDEIREDLVLYREWINQAKMEEKLRFEKIYRLALYEIDWSNYQRAYEIVVTSNFDSQMNDCRLDRLALFLQMKLDANSYLEREVSLLNELTSECTLIWNPLIEEIINKGSGEYADVDVSLILPSTGDFYGVTPIEFSHWIDCTVHSIVNDKSELRILHDFVIEIFSYQFNIRLDYVKAGKLSPNGNILFMLEGFCYLYEKAQDLGAEDVSMSIQSNVQAIFEHVNEGYILDRVDRKYFRRILGDGPW